jgi:hypothetical protein
MLMDLLAIHAYARRRCDPQAHLLAANRHDCDANLAIDYNCFINTSRQNQHFAR